jgi:peptidoglycan L-alanyl-D-glutamate endopeptidase CwlK
MAYTVRLAGVHPELAEKTLRILAAMEVVGFPMMVVSGIRTTEQQQALYAQGRTKLGPIVTQLDGVVKKSNHQSKQDGFGYAVDCCFVVNGVPSWDESLPWALYGAIAQSLGLVWGGAWKTFKDKPHIELRSSL